MVATGKSSVSKKALLVGIYRNPTDRSDAESLLDELQSLVETLDLGVVDKQLVRVIEPSSRYYTGTGKAGEIAALAQKSGADVIVFDNELLPSQQRNWETLSRLPVIDRQEVILDIFARRAQTKEARLQVQLAQLEYFLPRLTRAWAHLSRQGGGVGAKGEGESQLETDRRLVRKQIDRLRRDLDDVRSRRATQRKQRERLPLPTAAIVGYTNAGKSSLLKKLTGADVLVQDKPFATLDPTTRRVELPDKQSLLLTDTVGFVRNLPHLLVEAFQATLEEAVRSDFLIHVLDASHPRVFEFHQTTMEVLADLGADDKQMITVLNKVDLIENSAAIHALRLHFPDSIFASVQTGRGLQELLERCADLLQHRTTKVELALPLERTELVSLIHRTSNVLSLDYQDAHAKIIALVPPKVRARLQPFVVDAPTLVS
jgi:GTPase